MAIHYAHTIRPLLLHFHLLLLKLSSTVITLIVITYPYLTGVSALLAMKEINFVCSPKSFYPLHGGPSGLKVIF
jgi:hypothetical protein